MFAPSITSLFITGLLILLLVLFVSKHHKTLYYFDVYKKITILLLFIIAIGIHGLIHLGVEVVYKFNPYYLLVQ